MDSLQELINHLKETGVLKTDNIINAFSVVDRKNFVLEEYKGSCYQDRPLEIGYGQTISQPTTVSFMLELLQPKSGEKILDVGSGSGWTTSLLAHCVGNKGLVRGVERVPELVEYGKKNLSKYNFLHADIRNASDSLGLPSEAPYDKMLVSAGSSDIPKELVDQLKIEGTLVIPVQSAVVKVVKRDDKNLDIERFEGFFFVPLIH